MAYTFQTFVVGQVFTATQANQIETNIRDHVHGVGGVGATFGARVYVGSASMAGWGSAYGAIELGNNQSLFGAATGTAYHLHGLFFDGTDYRTVANSRRGTFFYSQEDGTFGWYRAVTGTVASGGISAGLQNIATVTLSGHFVGHDGAFYLKWGSAYIGNANDVNYAGFAHWNSPEHAIAQNSAGYTWVNAASNQAVALQVANRVHALVTASGMTVGSTSGNGEGTLTTQNGIYKGTDIIKPHVWFSPSSIYTIHDTISVASANGWITNSLSALVGNAATVAFLKVVAAVTANSGYAATIGVGLKNSDVTSNIWNAVEHLAVFAQVAATPYGVQARDGVVIPITLSNSKTFDLYRSATGTAAQYAYIVALVGYAK